MNIEEHQSKLLEARKQAKLHIMATQSSLAFIKSIMTDSNYQWALEEIDGKNTLFVKLKRRKMAVISLPDKSFQDRLPEIPTILNRPETLLADIPYPTNIKNCPPNMEWRGNNEHARHDVGCTSGGRVRTLS